MERLPRRGAEPRTDDPHLRGRGRQQGRAASSTRSSSAATRASSGASIRRELDASVTARVPTRTNRDDRYFADTFQAMPRTATRACSSACCDHPNIKLMLNTDYREVVDGHSVAADGLHRADRRVLQLPLRRLPYRCLEFEHVNLPQERFQPVGDGELSERLRLHAHHRVQAPHRPAASRPRRSSTNTRGPKAIRTTRCPGPRTPRSTSATRPLAERMTDVDVRRPARDLPLLQHGPGGGPGPGDVQADRQGP